MHAQRGTRPEGQSQDHHATNRHHDLALVGVALNLVLSANRCEHAAIVVLGIGPKPTRLPAAERCLVGSRLDAGLVRTAAALSKEGTEFEDDPHTPASYRRHVLPTLVERALLEALSRGRDNQR